MDGQLRRCDARAAFQQPLWWGALAVLVVNDHALKGSGLLPGALTGKLSDFAGLIVAPPVLASLLGVTRKQAFAGCALLIACVFASIKTCPVAAEAVEALSSRLGLAWRVWCDPTDLVALPALLLGLRCGRTFERSIGASDARSGWTLALHYAAVLAGSLACIATSMPAPASPRSVQADDSRRVYVAFLGGLVHVVDAPSGGLLRKIELEPERSSDWAIDGERIYGVGADGVVAHDVSSGKRLFRTDFDCLGCRAHVVAGGARVFVFVRHPGDYYATGAAEWVFALDREGGKVAWFQSSKARRPRTTAVCIHCSRTRR